MDPLHAILKNYWGYDAFRPAQEDAIRAVLDGNDTLVLLPTGGGKSVCFQVPALAKEGVCIVVTPLIALMKDQVDQLQKKKLPAAAIHTGMSKREIDIVLDNCIYGNTKFLYVSPERLRTELMIERAKKMNICLLVVDEAHCISQWGYDFRPSYLLIPEFHQFLAHVPIMALTATATEEVRADIQDKLQMKKVKVFTQSFARKNLSYSALKEENKERKLLHILSRIGGSGIVYVRSRKKTKLIADWLQTKGIPATHYHAGLTLKERSEKQGAWISNRIRIIVATNAFGMGIDKPDVRLVVHLEIPDNLDAYYQEAGRAGRDGQRAYSVALYDDKDLLDLQTFITAKYPPLETVRLVYQALANYCRLPVGSGEMASFIFDIKNFAKIFGLPTTETFHSLRLLESEGMIQVSDDFYTPSKINFIVDNNQLYDFRLRYPELDKFTQTLLRLYGGELFTDFVKISEKDIGASFFISEDETVKFLHFMSERNIILYEKKVDQPQLTFLTPRYDAEQLPINWNNIQRKKLADLSKVDSVINYALHQKRCRTQLLLDYFGEINSVPCDVCDICIANKKSSLEITSNETDLRNEILNTIKRLGKVSPRKLCNTLVNFEEQEVLSFTKQLLKTEEILYNDEGKLMLPL